MIAFSRSSAGTATPIRNGRRLSSTTGVSMSRVSTLLPRKYIPNAEIRIVLKSIAPLAAHLAAHDLVYYREPVPRQN